MTPDALRHDAVKMAEHTAELPLAEALEVMTSIVQSRLPDVQRDAVRLALRTCTLPLAEATMVFEKALLIVYLLRAGNVRKGAARLAGVDRVTFRRKMVRHKLKPPSKSGF